MRGRDEFGAAEQRGVLESFGKPEYQQILSVLTCPPSPLPTLGILMLDAWLLVCVLWLIRHGNVPGFLLSQILLSLVFFHGFSVLHECGHGSAFRQSWINVLIGHLASTFCLIPFYPWRYIHQKHHAWTGNLTQDPVLKSLRVWRDERVPFVVRVAWRTWIPLGALLQHVVYLTYPLTMWRAGEMSASKALRSFVSVAWLLGVYALLTAFIPEVRPQNFALAVVLFLIAEELVNLPHHMDMSTADSKLPVWAQYRATRSCYYPPGVSELLVLNFNFHIEHHLFPNLPWYRLRKARSLVKEALGDAYQEAVGIAWNVENRTRDLQAIVDRYRNSLEPCDPQRPTQST